MFAWLILVAATSAQLETDPARAWNTGDRLGAIELLQARVESADASRDSNADALRRTLVEWELAVHHYEAALEHMPPPPSSFDELRGEALYALSRYSEALPYLGPERVLSRLDALEALGRSADADAALELAAERFGEDHPRVGCARAKRLVAMGDDSAAVDRYRAVLASQPNDLEALFGLGQALARTGDRESALGVLQRHRELVPLMDKLEFSIRSLDLSPNHGPNHAELAGVRAELGQLEAAEQSYLDATRFAQDSEVVPIALRYARFLEQYRQNPDAAVAALRQAQKRARDARLFVRAGDILLRSGYRAEALGEFRRALELRPNDRAILQRAQEAGL